MKGKEVKFYWLEINSDTEYDEDIAIPEGQDPETFIKDLLVKFNEEEERRHIANPDYKIFLRKFIRLAGETGKEREIMVHCILDKVNMVTITRGDSSYDILKCQNCKFMIRRFTLETPDPFCFPDRVCTQCNKLFMSALNLKSHIKRGNHKIPDWYPDGV